MALDLLEKNSIGALTMQETPPQLLALASQFAPKSQKPLDQDKPYASPLSANAEIPAAPHQQYYTSSNGKDKDKKKPDKKKKEIEKKKKEIEELEKAKKELEALDKKKAEISKSISEAQALKEAEV